MNKLILHGDTEPFCEALDNAATRKNQHIAKEFFA